MSSIHNILSDIWGYNSFRPGQEEVINYLMQKKSLLAVMPTGAGKSLCYQIPALLFENQTIVVSPILSLMNDQVIALKDLGVKADQVHSLLSEPEKKEVWENFKNKKTKILYIAPESLMRESMINALKPMNISMFVVDEAHCIVKWGAAFRPQYEHLKHLKTHFPNAVISAFTATADEENRMEINNKLTDGNGKIFLYSFNRPNLSLAVQQKSRWQSQLLDFLEDRKNQAGIVYCLSQKQTESCAELLASKGFNSLPYHAGLESESRMFAQDKFMTEENIIICATIAFGMGIDKANVRFVVHVNLPQSMEAFYQEIGRAGRDGEEADTLLLFGYDDLFQRKRFIFQEKSSEDHKIKENLRLDYLMAYCDSAICRRQTLLSYFKESCEPCGKCDNCLSPPEMIEGTEYAQIVMNTIFFTGQYFGVTHIVSIIRGEENAKIKSKEHDKIKTFGVGRTASIDFWKTFIRQLVSSKYLTINIEKYGALQITPKGKKIANGEEEYFYRKIAFNTPIKEKRYKVEPISSEILNSEKVLLSSLKSKRLELAKQKSVPAYIIFPDTTLHQMILHKPQTLEEMGQINGVGSVKLENYGEVFLNIIKEFNE